jgi:hypothetical protein
MDIGSSNLNFQLRDPFLQVPSSSCQRLLSKLLPKRLSLCTHPCTDLNHLPLFHSFSFSPALLFHLPLSTFRVQQWYPWPLSITLFLIRDPHIISFVTVVFFVLILRSLYLWILPIVAFWRFWELVMSNSDAHFVTIMLSLPCMGVSTLLMHLSISFRLVSLSSVVCLVYFLLAALWKFFIPKIIINSLALPFRLLLQIISLFLSWFSFLLWSPHFQKTCHLNGHPHHLLLLPVSPSFRIFSQLLNDMPMWCQI